MNSYFECYILDYVNCKIYHTRVPYDVDNVQEYISEKLNISINDIHFLTSEEELEIEEL